MFKRNRSPRPDEEGRRPRPKAKRKKKFINPGFQVRYMIYIALMLVVSFFIMFACLYLGIWDGILSGLSTDAFEEQQRMEAEQKKENAWLTQQTEMAYALYLEDEDLLTESQQIVFKQILVETNKKLIPAFLIYLLWIVIMARLITFRVAGPLYRITQDMKEFGNGKLSKRIQLRKEDHCHEFAADINELFERMDLTIENLKKLSRDFDIDPDKKGEALRSQLERFETTADALRRRDGDRS